MLKWEILLCVFYNLIAQQSKLQMGFFFFYWNFYLCSLFQVGMMILSGEDSKMPWKSQTKRKLVDWVTFIEIPTSYKKIVQMSFGELCLM